MPYNVYIEIQSKKGGISAVNAITRRQRIAQACYLLLALVILFSAMSLISGVNPGFYKYKSYLLQAQAWLRGELALDQNYEYLELAVYEGKYYVSFPPVPAIPMVIWTLIFGDDVPGGLFQKVYIAIAALVVFFEVQRSKRMDSKECALWSIGICLASAMLPISLVGGVWYEAQILAFLFCVCAISALRRKKPILACLFYALSVGCRPFSVVLGPVLLMMYIENARKQRLSFAKGFGCLLPGLIVGLCIAACYGAYNYARFGDVFEFGHNYLPEFTRAQHGQLSLKYVSQNWKTLFFGAPFSINGTDISINQFGFSMFISCPILICNALWFFRDLLSRRMTAAKWVIIAMGSLNTFLLLMHRTLGGHQFGLRYALELVPLCLCWYLLSPHCRKMKRWECVVLCFGLAFNFIGGCLVHI